MADTFTLTPPKIESYFGISRGHIHHVDNSYGFADRFPYRTPVEVGWVGGWGRALSGPGGNKGAGLPRMVHPGLQARTWACAQLIALARPFLRSFCRAFLSLARSSSRFHNLPTPGCPLQGLYSCSAGTHPGGSVIGCAGHNAAARVVSDLGLARRW